MKKTTHWITIPDETLHTPVSGKPEKPKAKKTNENPVTNKFLWGAGFVILIIASFALLAPSQFSALLKGSLFDTSGVSEEEFRISLVPDKKDEEKSESETTSSSDESSLKENGESELNGKTDLTSGAVVKPEEEAVSISVTPISSTEDCGEDIDCFLGNLKECSLAKSIFSYKVSDKEFETELEITGSEGDDCLFTAKFTKSDEASLEGEIAECKLAKGDYKEEDIEKIFSEKADLENTCAGSGAEILNKYISSLVSESALSEETDEQTKLIAQLQKQIEQLQTQRHDDIKTMEGLAGAVEEAQETVRSAATPLPGVTSTSIIGQPQTVQPAFRANPYKVSVTPEQMLQQNLAQGGQYYAQQIAANQVTAYQEAQAYYQPSQVPAPVSGVTPQTGPSEVLFITFVLTFMALVGWKFIKSFA